MIRLLRLHLWRLAAYVVAFIGISLAYWIDRMFGEPSIDQIQYHLVYAEGAALQMSEVFLATFVVEVLLLTLVSALGVTLLHGILAERWPAWKRHVLRASPPFALCTSLVALMLQFSLFSYAAAHFATDQFAERYVDPKLVHVQPQGARRNLLLIYVESLETTYGNPALFGRDLLAPLRAVGGQELAPLRPAPGATWTIGGIVATQCGVPLKVYSEHDVRRMRGERVYLPGATCLGDLMQAHGWHNVFMGGAPLSFSGKGTFLQDHGFAETYGRDEWERAGLRKGERNIWGLYDSALFERARARLATLQASGRPFMLSLLTLDTHNPFGFLSPACQQRGVRDFAGIVECGAAQIAEFIRAAREQGLLENTVVVVVGDHLAVPNPLYEKLKQAQDRRMFNLVLAPDLPPVTASELSPFDLYPTLLELVGLQADGSRLGLGVSAFANPQPPRPGAPLPLAALRGSSMYRSLWQPVQ